MKITCTLSPFSFGVIDFLITDGPGKCPVGSKIRAAEPLEFKDVFFPPDLVDLANREIRPTFRLSNQDAQLLMDNLWQCGLRPSEGTGSAGSLKATQDHLADMQKIAFGLLERKTKAK